MSDYVIQKNPFIVPTTDGKLIEEFFGNASISLGDYSIAHMIAPSGWSEPFQNPAFDEITYVVSGRKKFEIDHAEVIEEIILEKNQSVCIKRGSKVRYSNPFDEPVEYISICIPAFTLERAGREEG
ncbi:MAG: cupin domain-containing protein [Bacteroidetes bacterium]|nr:cupin domain-containing protein [Bacteroidota bacterium]